jgi:hypothetical protein
MDRSIVKKGFKFLLAGIIACFFVSLPEAKPQASQFKVLGFYYSSLGDLAHVAYSTEANSWFPTAAAANGFTYESTTNWGDLNATKLAGYKVIIFINGMPWDGTQRNAFQTYIKNGGGWIGCHVAAFSNTIDPAGWPWFTDTLLGSKNYKNNTWAPTTAVLAVEDTAFAITKGFPIKFTGPVNEWYAWTGDIKNNTNLKVLCSIHTDSYPLGTGTGSGGASEIWQNNGEYRPIIWINKNYKAMYTNIGHDDVDYGTGIGKTKTFSYAQYDTLMIRAIKYFAGALTSIEGNEAAKTVLPVHPNISIKTDKKSISIVVQNSAGPIKVTLTDIRGKVIQCVTGNQNSYIMNRETAKSGTYIINVKGTFGSMARTLTVD